MRRWSASGPPYRTRRGSRHHDRRQARAAQASPARSGRQRRAGLQRHRRRAPTGNETPWRRRPLPAAPPSLAGFLPSSEVIRAACSGANPASSACSPEVLSGLVLGQVHQGTQRHCRRSGWGQQGAAATWPRAHRSARGALPAAEATMDGHGMARRLAAVSSSAVRPSAKRRLRPRASHRPGQDSRSE